MAGFWSHFYQKPEIVSTFAKYYHVRQLYHSNDREDQLMVNNESLSCMESCHEPDGEVYGVSSRSGVEHVKNSLY